MRTNGQVINTGSQRNISGSVAVSQVVNQIIYCIHGIHIDSDEFAARGFRNIGAWILGRNMFGPIRGP